jgi:antitoxin FitA
MTLHLIKLCVGADSLDDLRQWTAARMMEAKRRGAPIRHAALDKPGEITDISGLNGCKSCKGPPMAGNLHVRNLDDDLIARLKRRAARHGRSAEAEHREILRQALAGEEEASFDKLAADLRKLTRGRRQTPSEILLREGRDER